LLIVAVVALLAGTVTLLALDPAESSLFPPCPFHALTGLHCPGCGSTRALHRLLHGDVGAALGLNALMVLAIPLLAYAGLSRLVESVFGRPLPGVPRPTVSAWAALALLIAFGVLRNLPFEPFTCLAP